MCKESFSKNKAKCAKFGPLDLLQIRDDLAVFTSRVHVGVLMHAVEVFSGLLLDCRVVPSSRMSQLLPTVLAQRM